jgi:hypothetical protein
MGTLVVAWLTKVPKQAGIRADSGHEGAERERCQVRGLTAPAAQDFRRRICVPAVIY